MSGRRPRHRQAAVQGAHLPAARQGRQEGGAAAPRAWPHPPPLRGVCPVFPDHAAAPLMWTSGLILCSHRAGMLEARFCLSPGATQANHMPEAEGGLPLVMDGANCPRSRRMPVEVRMPPGSASQCDSTPPQRRRFRERDWSGTLGVGCLPLKFQLSNAHQAFKPQHWTGEPIDTAMVLLHKIVAVFHLMDNDRPTMFVIVPPDGRGIGFAPINGDRLRHPMIADGLGEKTLGREEGIDGVASLVHRTMQITPLACDLHRQLPLANEALTPQALRTAIHGYGCAVGE